MVIENILKDKLKKEYAVVNEDHYDEYLEGIFSDIRNIIKEKENEISNITGINNISNKLDKYDITIIYTILTRLHKIESAKKPISLKSIHTLFNEHLYIYSDMDKLIVSLLILDYKYKFDIDSSILKFYVNIDIFNNKN